MQIHCGMCRSSSWLNFSAKRLQINCHQLPSLISCWSEVQTLINDTLPYTYISFTSSFPFRNISSHPKHCRVQNSAQNSSLLQPPPSFSSFVVLSLQHSFIHKTFLSAYCIQDQQILKRMEAWRRISCILHSQGAYGLTGQKDHILWQGQWSKESI